MNSIILLHGAIGAADQLQPLASELAKLNYNVFTFSFSGHGQMPFENEMSIHQFANELKAFIVSNKLNQPHIFGYSMGGYVALYLAAIDKDLLGHIITLGTKFKWDPEIAQREIKQLDPETIQLKVPKFAEALQTRHGNDWKKLLAQTAQMMIGLGEKNELTPELFSKVENKVMIGLADKDAMVSIEETTSVYKQLKNSCMYMLPQTKHPIETVDMIALAAITHNFFK
ncbi:MAG: alpha/beta hydrolase [Sphingobacteriaceae bacterium]